LLSFLSRLDKTKTSLSQKLFFRFRLTRKEEDKQHKEDKDKDELKKKKKKRARRKKKKKKKKISTTTSQNQHHKKKKKYIINVGFTQTSGKSLEQKRVHEFILLVLKVRRRGGVVRESRDTV
jgi:hypothetical protein